MVEKPPLSSFLKSPIQQEDLEPTPTPEAVLKTLRGVKGDKGDTGNDAIPPTVEFLEGLIKPLIPEPIPGLNGKTPTKQELVSLITPLIPAPIPGVPGESVEVEEIEAMMLSLLPDVQEIPDITPKEVIEKINVSRGTKIKASKVEGLDELEGLARSANRNVQNFISLGGNRQTKLQLNGAAPLTGVDTINFIGGTLTPVGDGTTANYTPPSSGGGSGYQAVTGGAVNGTNQVFTWSTAPNVIVVDQGRPMQKVSSDGTVNWTGTTTTTLAVAPNFDIFASA